MGSIPIEQAMVAIQQAKLAMQQGLKFADEEQYALVEKQLQQARQVISVAKQKASANEEQLLEQANVTIVNTLEELHERKRTPNLQNG
ncbi:hypothetical protein AWH56_019295 [Anaerobacillus isosaccharinicus]|uniref:Uncharacterized protein n=1 Tax=Anaerobacillus isosaccharinicus TaxID=1532552 RepID=A0A1S2LNC0_9BACI|nr:hypothetical protein [Anaerobacillus isosaccharinicus]MBA5586949.1 hypothetical protein [Anaerobacillus isosaccharinicus]QOY34846.1 hypothetical protein AWH56_019295 [Anaerobacillus isosaccharinicus]